MKWWRDLKEDLKRSDTRKGLRFMWGVGFRIIAYGVMLKSTAWALEWVGGVHLPNPSAIPVVFFMGVGFFVLSWRLGFHGFFHENFDDEAGPIRTWKDLFTAEKRRFYLGMARWATRGASYIMLVVIFGDFLSYSEIFSHGPNEPFDLARVPYMFLASIVLFGISRWLGLTGFGFDEKEVSGLE